MGYKAYCCLLTIIVVAIILFASNFQNAFHEDQLNVDNIMHHIEELSSADYQGRLAGSDGNDKALKYMEAYFEEIGLAPAGFEDTYFQPFSVLIPQVDRRPVFQIHDSSGSATADFKMYEDYSVVLSPNGGGIDFSGEFLVLGADFLRVDPEQLKNRIAIIEFNQVTPMIVSHIMEAGGKGVLCNTNSSAFNFTNRYEETKALNVAGKSGESILVGYISTDTYRTLQNSSSTSLRIKVNIEYPIVDTANILAKIEGKASEEDTLIISTNIDGLGMGVEDSVFPGATNSASGMAIMMEVARVMKQDDAIPYKTVVFAGWNGQKQQLSGSNYYINHALYPLESTTLIQLDAIGNASIEGLAIASDPVDGILVGEKISKYAADSGLFLKQGFSGNSVITQFSDKSVPGVMLLDSDRVWDSYKDVYEEVDSLTIKNAAQVLLIYLKRVIYKDLRLDYLTLTERFVLSLLFLGGMVSMFIGSAYMRDPISKIGGQTIENIYFSTPLLLLRKFYTSVVPYFFAVFLLAVFANIDSDANAKIINGHLETNTSLWLILKRSLLYLRSLFDLSTYQSDSLRELLSVIYDASKLSVALVSAALILSFTVGIFRGMIEGYRSKKSKIGSLGTLLFFSIPEVLIVLFVLLAYTSFAKRFPDLKEIMPLKAFILPLFTLSIIPTIYVSRISLIAIQEELGKDYIKNEKAKGFSRRKIIFVELLPAVVFKVVDLMPTLVTILLSNMIIVEYLFNYQGILYYLIYLYNRQDVSRFVPLALTLGIIYLVFTKGFQLLAQFINPLKRREVS